jgi:cytochrome c biogenesis protein CcmG/thiol:disulfide interchange protein DsbE
MIPTDELEDYPKRTSSKPLVLLIGLVAIAALAYGVLKQAPDAGDAGREVPGFELELLDGSGTLSDSDLRGEPVVLNFWASWCAPCLEEMPLFEAKWRAYKDEGLTFVGVVFEDTRESALDFVQANDITYPILWDPDKTLGSALGVDPLPETFFIDSGWQLVAGVQQELQGGGIRTFGAIDEAQLQDRIDELLEAGS